MKKIFMILFVVVLLIVNAFPVFADENEEIELYSLRLNDAADLLTEDEEIELLSYLDEVSERQGCDIVVVTTYSTGERSVVEFADDYYDYNYYSDDGVLLLISMEERDWYISTTGYCIYAITDDGIDYFGEQMYDSLHNGDYYTAFMTYADLCDDFLNQAETGKPYDSHSLPKKPLEVKWIFISLGIGVIIALIVTGIMKSKLKTVRYNPAASNYIKHNSLNIRDGHELYLYSSISRRERQEKSSGSSTHTSSSGTSHGGGGGKF